jgi:hypothetical protein
MTLTAPLTLGSTAVASSSMEPKCPASSPRAGSGSSVEPRPGVQPAVQPLTFTASFDVASAAASSDVTDAAASFDATSASASSCVSRHGRGNPRATASGEDGLHSHKNTASSGCAAAPGEDDLHSHDQNTASSVTASGEDGLHSHKNTASSGCAAALGENDLHTGP